MVRYKCVKPLHLDLYDDNGCWVEEEGGLTIEVGEVFELDEDCDRLLIANSPAVRLQNTRRWIEIYPDTLAEHFVKEGE